jgi:predicted O-methyltransferase YrrM
MGSVALEQGIKDGKDIVMVLFAELASALKTDPAEFVLRSWAKVREFPERWAQLYPYVAQSGWEQSLHEMLQSELPCPGQSMQAPIWDDILQRLKLKGITPGPASYLGHNDGDPAFIRAIWCLTTHLQARTIVETGVAHGVTSRFVLEGLVRNGGGHLWSIDLPPQTVSGVHDEIGSAVSDELRPHWTYIRGSSRRYLPPLLRKIGTIDLFVHDSLHSEYNMLFELRTAWPHVRPGGAVVVDDIDNNRAFDEFAKSVPEHLSMVCEAEPLRPDPLRVSRRRPGLFGVILKNR